MEERQWVVVTFEDDTVAALPSCWLTGYLKGKQQAYWPKSKNVSAMVRRWEPPVSDWPQFNVKVLGFYDNYDTALKKSAIAEVTSDLSTDSNTFRKRKKNRKYAVSSSSAEENSDDSNSYPNFPSINIINKKVETAFCSPSTSRDMAHEVRVPTQPTDEEDNFTNNINPKVRSSTQCTNCAINDTDFKRQVLTKLNIIMAKLSCHDDNFAALQGLLENQVPITKQLDEIIPGLELLPIRNDANLIQFEQIMADKENFKKIVAGLGRMGGSTIPEISKKIMYHLLTNDFGQLYSWEGGKGKRKFRELSVLKQLIFDAVRMNKRTEKACEDQIIIEIKKWLAKAKDRCNRKKSVRDNAAEEQNPK